MGLLILGWLVNVPDAYHTLLESGDFIMVNVRTILYVIICMPLFFVAGPGDGPDPEQLPTCAG